VPDYGHPLRFGTFISPTNSPAHRPVELSQLSERLGFDLVTFQDHPYLSNFLDTWTLLSWVAARTERIGISGNVLNLPPAASRPPCSPAQLPALTCSPVAGDTRDRSRELLGFHRSDRWTEIDPTAKRAGTR
jgi:hypothetical protein